MPDRDPNSLAPLFLFCAIVIGCITAGVWWCGAEPIVLVALTGLTLANLIAAWLETTL